ncbi:MAG: hypothetical protein CUN54_08815, partial [Phototrophicales bacterium]
MKKLIVLLVAVVITVALTSVVSAQDDSITQETVVGWIANAALGIEAGEIEGTSATLTRHENGVHVEVQTSDLEPGHAFTMWWVIFNEPENCTDGECGADDVLILDENGDPMLDDEGGLIFNADQMANVNISFLRADGHVIDENGTATFRSR